MPAFNRTFFDLNEERQYILAESSPLFPSSVIADLKLSVPSLSDIPSVAGIFIKGNAMRVIIVSGNKLAAGFSSDSKYSLKKHRIYPLKSYAEGYAGVISFGSGLSQDVSVSGDFPVSEECLSRFKPSAVPYVSVPCTQMRLTGQVLLGGDGVNTQSSVETLPDGYEDLFGGVKETLVLDLIDSGRFDNSNPLIRFANGVNGYNDVQEQKSPVYSIHGVRPDSNGTLFIHFGSHFHIAGIVPNSAEAEAVSAVAVGSDITAEQVCGTKDNSGGDSGGTDGCPITFVKVEYE